MTSKLIGLILERNGTQDILMLPDTPRLRVATPVTLSAAEVHAILSELDSEMPDKAFIRKGQRVSMNRLRQEIWRRDGYKCVYCGRELGDVTMTLDHFIPASAGGAYNKSNLVSCCVSCNRAKADSSPEMWLRAAGIYDQFKHPGA